MKITMLQNKWASPDGHTLRHLVKGETYDLPELLAGQLISADYAHSAEVYSRTMQQIDQIFGGSHV